MEYIRVQNGMSCVYGNLSGQQGPALMHWPEWAAAPDVAFLLSLIYGNDGTNEPKLSRSGICFRNFKVGGSSYRLFYKRDQRVECITVEPLDKVSRPLSFARNSAAVSYLHFYRPLNENKWQQLLPGQDVKLSSNISPALVPSA